MKKLFLFLAAILLLISCKSNQDVKNNQKQGDNSRASGLVIATKVVKPVTVDGDLSEWKDLKSYLVTEDMNVRSGGINPVDKDTTVIHSNFYVQWDEKNIYLACDVADNIIVNNIPPNDEKGFYRTDSVEFYIDNRESGNEKQLFKIAVLPFDTKGNAHAIRHEDANPGPIRLVSPDVQFAAKKTDKGYSVEIAIPFKYITKRTPDIGMKLGFSHTVHNSNDPDAAKNKIGEYVRDNMISWNPIPEIWNRWKYWSDLVLK